MKFGRRYSIYVKTEGQRLLPECPFVEFKRFKKMLKKCSSSAHSESTLETSASGPVHPVPEGGDSTTDCDEELRSLNGKKEIPSPYPPCPVCDAEFFPTLEKTLKAVVNCFNVRVDELLRLHLASGFRKYLVRLRSKISCDRETMTVVGNTLINYGCMSSLAVRKILKKYDKVHSSETGQAFKSRLQLKRVELLQSPMLIELSALAVNLMDNDLPVGIVNPGVLGCHISYNFEHENKIISCIAPDKLRIDYDLTCSICLEIVFDPVALGCGHIFCKRCACSAGSVPTFQGPTTARRSSKCPLCRQAGVFPLAVQLDEVQTLVTNRWSEYCSERLPIEREHRLREAKEYWEKETQAFIGF